MALTSATSITSHSSQSAAQPTAVHALLSLWSAISRRISASISRFHCRMMRLLSRSVDVAVRPRRFTHFPRRTRKQSRPTPPTPQSRDVAGGAAAALHRRRTLPSLSRPAAPPASACSSTSCSTSTPSTATWRCSSERPAHLGRSSAPPGYIAGRIAHAYSHGTKVAGK